MACFVLHQSTHLFVWILILFIDLFASAGAGRSSNHNPPPSSSSLSPPPTTRSLLLLLDVDNTLYKEQVFGIEQQIVDNIYSYCHEFCNVTAHQADDLHHHYGSTIEGLRATIWKNKNNKYCWYNYWYKKKNDPSLLKKLVESFYKNVYDTVDVSSLLRCAATTTNTTTTGYTHATNGKEQDLLRKILFGSVPSNAETTTAEPALQLHLASNSPRAHVAKIVQALGLTRIPWSGIWTPDRRPTTTTNNSDNDKNDNDHNVDYYPTKANLKAFFGPLLQQQQQQMIIIDDSKAALDACAKYNIQGLQVSSSSTSTSSSPSCSVTTALCMALGWLENNASLSLSSSSYTFAQVEYLRSKNRVDVESVHRETWERLAVELKQILIKKNKKNEKSMLCVVDVGAGLLSMLKLVLFGHDDDLPSLLNSIVQTKSPAGRATNTILMDRVDYYAYEPNKELEYDCRQVLEQHLGLELQESFQWKNKKINDDADGSIVHDPEHIFVKELDNGIRITVHLRLWDFRHEHQHAAASRSQPTPHLVVGCCFADLFDPLELTRSLLLRFLSPTTTRAEDNDFSETLLYFPITFRGITQFLPSQPFESVEEGGRMTIPSDTTAFALYSRALCEDHGHNLDPEQLVQAMGDYGGVCLARGASDWVVDPERHDYLWNTMLYFFGTVAAPEVQAAGWNARLWLERARTNRPTIRASNVDLLFRMPHLGQWNFDEEKSFSRSSLVQEIPRTYQEIQFQAPNQVAAVTKRVAAKLEPNQVLVESVFSLISSGTELKVFRGQFDDASLDVNIKGLEDERMAYPLAYGYSLVGRVIACGEDVHDADILIGRLVFAFAPHASLVLLDREALRVVPDGIDASDAIFMPSVETALSLVQDANARFGETVVVFGQGLVGLLVTAILSLSTPETIPLTTVDSIPSRLAASASMGSTQALLPPQVMDAAPFDIAIEVSGNGKALQSAIDATRDGGRIVVGSWYGNSTVDLKLGIDFHRSHKSLKASQVSEIPAELRSTWTKERRFQLTWELVKTLRPSRRLLTRTYTLDDAQKAYTALDEGKEIAIAFEYK